MVIISRWSCNMSTQEQRLIPLYENLSKNHRDDTLRYDEPWGWMMPVRHALGALLLEQGHYDEAEAVYTKDLELHPGNGWALKGLATVYS
jgi:tetratricopeptide (TPR) repeat protein